MTTDNFCFYSQNRLIQTSQTGGQWYSFCIDVTFEMRTVLRGIPLFNDTISNVGQHFILNRNGGEESKIAERHRESVCVRDGGSMEGRRR